MMQAVQIRLSLRSFIFIIIIIIVGKTALFELYPSVENSARFFC
jgi:hypothetical protein